MPRKSPFKPDCKRCHRLVRYLKQTLKQHPDYYCKPVPAIGDQQAKLLIVGMAPGKHGANASGIPFTGDASGDMLFNTLYKFGFSNLAADQKSAERELINCRITNAVKCLPPDNKPVAEEINNCNRYLATELMEMQDSAVIVALGKLAHDATLKALFSFAPKGVHYKRKDFVFAHASEYRINTQYGERILLSSYHCSRYNTQTRRLTQNMFNQVFLRAKHFISHDRE